MKKSKIEKLIKKLLGPELAAIDNRLLELELKIGIKTLAEIDPLWYGEMAVKDAEHLVGAKEPHFLELPEKWCVKDCEEVSEWASKKFNCCNVISDNYLHVGETSSDKVYSFLTRIEKGFTQISFSDFERLVLKKGQAKKSEELVLGKWYKQGKSFAGVKQYLIYIVRKDDLGVEGYGICDGVWFNNGNSYCKDLIPATNEEFEAALIAEFLRRYKVGDKVKCATGGDYNDEIKRVDDLWFKDGKLWCGSHGGVNTCIFKDGIWAEIIEQPEENIQDVDFETLEIKKAFELASDVLKRGMTSLDFLNENKEGKSDLKDSVIQHINNILKSATI